MLCIPYCFSLMQFSISYPQDTRDYNELEMLIICVLPHMSIGLDYIFKEITFSVFGYFFFAVRINTILQYGIYNSREDYVKMKAPRGADFVSAIHSCSGVDTRGGTRSSRSTTQHCQPNING